MTDEPTDDEVEDGPGQAPAHEVGQRPAEDAAPEDAAPEDRDPLLDRAERIAELPLDERPAAFDGLNRAVVAELQSLDED